MDYLRSLLQYTGLQSPSEKEKNYQIDKILKKNDDLIVHNHRKLMQLTNTLYNFGLAGGDIENDFFKQKCLELASLFILSLRSYWQTRECDEEMAFLQKLANIHCKIWTLFRDEFYNRESEWRSEDMNIMFYRLSATLTIGSLPEGKTTTYMERDLVERNSIDLKTYAYSDDW